MPTLEQLTQQLTEPFDHPHHKHAIERQLHLLSGGGHTRHGQIVNLLLWVVGPVVATAGVFASHLLVVGVLLTVAQFTNRFGLAKYGVPVWIKSVFVVCLLGAVIIAAEPVIAERTVSTIIGIHRNMTGK